MRRMRGIRVRIRVMIKIMVRVMAKYSLMRLGV